MSDDVQSAEELAWEIATLSTSGYRDWAKQAKEAIESRDAAQRQAGREETEKRYAAVVEAARKYFTYEGCPMDCNSCAFGNTECVESYPIRKALRELDEGRKGCQE